MKKLTTLSFLLVLPLFALCWGVNGHRAVGMIAEENLSRKAMKRLNKILEGNSLAEVSNWMDDIKSDDAYDHTHDWHWVTIPTGEEYSSTDLNPNGDIIAKTLEIIAGLKSGNLSPQTEIEYLKYLVHLVGDIHQPLHVGGGDDAGGNRVEVKWFGDSSNLHRVWDSEMIESKNLSFTELVAFIDKPDKTQIAAWQKANVIDWAKESVSLRNQVYSLPEDNNLRYEYLYQNFDTVKSRISQAGVRLAGILNEIYG